MGISAVAWESTTGVSQGPSVTTECQCECETFSPAGCWVCTSTEHRLMSMGLLWFHPALLLRLHFPSFPEQQGRSRLALQRFPHTHTQTHFFSPVLPVSPTMTAIHKAYEAFLFSDLLGWLFLACLNGSASLTANIQKTHLSLFCRSVKLWERRNAGIKGAVKKYTHARREGNSGMERDSSRLELAMQEEKFLQTLFFFLIQETSICIGIWAHSCPSHEIRDRQTHWVQSLQMWGTAKVHHSTQRSFTVHGLPKLCAAAWPSAEERFLRGGGELQSGVMCSASRESSIWLCCVLGWDLSILHQRKRQKWFKHSKSSAVLPVGRCSPAVYFVSALVNPEASESSQLCSQLSPYPKSGWAPSLHGSSFPRREGTMGERWARREENCCAHVLEQTISQSGEL